MSDLKELLAISLLILAGLAAAAEDQGMHLIQPKGTELVLIKILRGNELSARFGGQLWVSGTVVGRWPAGATNTVDKEPEVLLVPDTDSVAVLPYFVLRDPPYFNQYRVRSITLLNATAALRMAAGASKTLKLLERRVNHVHAVGRFLITQYVVGVECDAPWARAVLLKADIPEKVAQQQAVPEGC